MVTPKHTAETKKNPGTESQRNNTVRLWAERDNLNKLQSQKPHRKQVSVKSGVSW